MGFMKAMTELSPAEVKDRGNRDALSNIGMEHELPALGRQKAPRYSAQAINSSATIIPSSKTSSFAP